MLKLVKEGDLVLTPASRNMCHSFHGLSWKQVFSKKLNLEAGPKGFKIAPLTPPEGRQDGVSHGQLPYISIYISNSIEDDYTLE